MFLGRPSFEWVPIDTMYEDDVDLATANGIEDFSQPKTFDGTLHVPSAEPFGCLQSPFD